MPSSSACTQRSNTRRGIAAHPSAILSRYGHTEDREVEMGLFLPEAGMTPEGVDAGQQHACLK
jgi:hypothetical protein